MKSAVVRGESETNVSAGKKYEVALMKITVNPESHQYEKQQTQNQSWPLS